MKKSWDECRLFAIFATLLALGFSLVAQPKGGSIVTRSIPSSLQIVFDAAGNTYSTGSDGTVTPGAAQTKSTDEICTFVGGPFPLVEPCGDAHITKYDATGNIVFGSLLGGPKADAGSALAVDSVGNVYVTGTAGASFPTTPNAAIRTGGSGFVAKLSADGSKFLYTTYLPAGFQLPSAIAVDPQGNAYITGRTTADHAFIAALNADGSEFSYTATLAGSLQDRATAIAVDAEGNAVIGGYTDSLDFPVTPDAPSTPLGGFVARFDPSGRVLYATYFAGIANTIVVDSDGNIFVAGALGSPDFPTTPGTLQPEPLVPMWNSSPGGFLTKFSPDARTIVYSTYVPSIDNGSLREGVASIVLSGEGGVYVAGGTGAGFPITDSAPQPCFGGRTDVYVAHLDSMGKLLDATYIGGAIDDSVYGLALADDKTIRLAWHANGATLNISQIRFGEPGWAAPSCLSGDVLNSANLYSRGSISPGAFVSLTGLGIGPLEGIGYQPDQQGRAPLTLAGVKVFFDGQPAAIVYAQSKVVNVLAPFELAGKSSTAVALEYGGTTHGPISVPVDSSETGIFRLQPGGSVQALAINEDGTINGPSNPASKGSTVMLWGTGFGQTMVPCMSGELNSPATNPLVQPATLFDGSFGNFHIVSSGGAPGLLCGIVQINLQVPTNVPSGSLRLGTNGSLSTVATIAVK